MSARAGRGFRLVEATLEDIRRAFKAGTLSASELTRMYLDRIEAYDQRGPAINCIVNLNPGALEEAGRLDAAYKASGPVGPLHGVPVIIKDQFDLKGMPTTFGSVLFKDFHPDRDAFVTTKLKQAGAVILGKATLGELGGGDTHGSLFGSTRNPYDLERTPGGSSGGPAAAVAANFAAVAVGQEGFASIRRPAAWNGIAGMRTTAGMVSRAGVLDGWPSIAGTLGPFARTVTDLAVLLDVLVGYDPEDPLTAAGFGHIPPTYTAGLKKDALKGARIGILREPMGHASEPESEDFRELTRVFDESVRELKDAGAEVVDPIVIPDLARLLATRPGSFADGDPAFEVYMARNANPPYRSRAEAISRPEAAVVHVPAQNRWRRKVSPEEHLAYRIAREELMLNLLKVMADHRLDAIAHKAVEHSATRIADGLKPPYVDMKGGPHINTFLVFVPSIVVPAGFTRQNMPAGLCFLGRPYDDARLIRYAYAYEQATRHRKPPASVPAL